MSNISVSKGSSVISPALCVTVGFPERGKSVHWNYNIISLSLTEQVRHADVIRGRPVEFIKCSVLKDHLTFTTKQEVIVPR